MKAMVTRFGLVMLLFVGACTAPVVPQDRYYRLDVSMPSAGVAVKYGVIEIDRFVAVGLTAGRAIVFTTDANTLVMQEFNYDFWHEPPSVMLRDALVSYLRKANVATSIVTPKARARADYLLSGRILRLETRRGASPVAVVELELGLTNTVTGDILLIRSYRTDVPASDASVGAAVIAANKAVGDIYARFLNDISRL